MEQTKCWVIVRSNYSMWATSSPVAVFLSKQEADFFVWEKRQEPLPEFSLGRSSYSVIQLPIISREKTGKNWDKFVKERLVEIEKSITENTSHSTEDLERVASLEKEKEVLKLN